MPIDADVARRSPARCQLEQSPARGEGILDRLGSHAAAPAPRHPGADEIHRGKRQKFYTVLSDLVHGEVIGLAPERTKDSLTGLLTTSLDARQRAAVEAVCTDMHRPYLNAAADVARGHRRARQVSRRAACGRGPG
ncbi:MAG: hypothetical protein DMF89_21980 [Acidobacteria bacterium]|nr:MAG: hypothetical protein DMF89_21980 [Acidobacteriota bacterium]